MPSMSRYKASLYGNMLQIVGTLNAEVPVRTCLGKRSGTMRAADKGAGRFEEGARFSENDTALHSGPAEPIWQHPGLEGILPYWLHFSKKKIPSFIVTWS